MLRGSGSVEWERVAALSAIEAIGPRFGPAVCSRADEIVSYAEWSAGVTAGVVTLEHAAHEDYTGAWEAIGTMSFSASATNSVKASGLNGSVRTRVSTAVVGGTVTIHMGAR